MKRMGKQIRGLLPAAARRGLAAIAITLAVGAAGNAVAQTGAAIPQSVGSASGLPLPRYVSLKSDRVNLRTGPGTEYPITWVFRRAGQPVEILAELEAWRQVRDADGATGWVLQSMLSGRRTALVLPWEAKNAKVPVVELRESESTSAQMVASIEAGVIANVRSCGGRWCLVVVGDYRGFIEQKKLWGVHEGEVIR
jgi:SH3-like domain-containing protein